MIPDTILKKLREHCEDDNIYELLAGMLAYEDENFSNKNSNCQKVVENYIKENRK